MKLLFRAPILPVETWFVNKKIQISQVNFLTIVQYIQMYYKFFILMINLRNFDFAFLQAVSLQSGFRSAFRSNRTGSSTQQRGAACGGPPLLCGLGKIGDLPAGYWLFCINEAGSFCKVCTKALFSNCGKRGILWAAKGGETR